MIHRIASIAVVMAAWASLHVSWVNAEMVTLGAMKDNTLYQNATGQLSNGSAGSGTIGHLAGEYFKLLSGTSILHIPYKGGAQAAMDVMTGNVQMMFDPANGVSPHVKSGKLRGLAVTSLKRAAAFPEIPTVA